MNPEALERKKNKVKHQGDGSSGATGTHYYMGDLSKKNEYDAKISKKNLDSTLETRAAAGVNAMEGLDQEQVKREQDRRK